MGFTPSGEQFDIVAGGQRAIVVEVGGGVRQYTVDGSEVFDGYAVEEMCSGARGCPLVPWPNRLADGAYTFHGTRHQVALTEPQTHNAIHGFLLWRNWTVRERERHRIVMGTRLHPLMGYPFGLDVAIEYALWKEGLVVTTTATNIGDTACPYATGHHPYLTAGTELIDDCTLELGAGTWLSTDDRGLPTGREEVAGSDYDFHAARKLGDQRIDHAFTDLTRSSDGLATARLTADSGSWTELWADENYPFLEIYTGDTQPPDKRRRGLGVEPMTCAPNGFGSGDGLLELDPGQSKTTRWGIRSGQR